MDVTAYLGSKEEGQHLELESLCSSAFKTPTALGEAYPSWQASTSQGYSCTQVSLLWNHPPAHYECELVCGQQLEPGLSSHTWRSWFPPLPTPLKEPRIKHLIIKKA